MCQNYRVQSVLLAILLALTLLGCGSSNAEPAIPGVGDAFEQQQPEVTTNADELNENIKNDEVTLTFKEAVESSRVWFYGDYNIAKDSSPDIIVVFENGTPTVYRAFKSYSMLTFGELSNMTDKEIINYCQSNLSTDDICPYESFDFELITDDSGNTVVGENVCLHTQLDGSFNAYETFPDIRPEKYMTNIGNYISRNQIYDVYYQGFFYQNQKYDFPDYFVTRCDEHTFFTYDQLGTPGVTEQ